MAPTVFREGPFRFFFFSREETRLHVHVQTADGEANFWLEPRIELAQQVGMPPKVWKAAMALVESHETEIRDAWHRHFASS